MTARKKAPLPLRDGLGPVRLIVPHHQSPARTLLEFLRGQHPDEPWQARVDAGELVDRAGRPVTTETVARAGAEIYFYRTPAPEPVVPFPMEVLHQDRRIVVVDKPHFLATIPRGQHVTQTALVRLRQQWGLDDAVPAHRLDRMTAGVLLFVVDPTLRRAYQELFAQQRVVKTYEAVAGFRADLEFPRTVRTRIVKEHGVMVARQEPGEPNSETLVELLEQRGAHARYRLTPRTGRTHQLRLHLCSLGIPIVNDNYYPHYRPQRGEGFDRPLQLLARAMAFEDPVTGEPRRFVSALELESLKR